MTDLIARLRGYKPYRIGEGEWFGPKVCEEAADELSALRERVEALEAELQAKKDADLDRHIFAWFNDFDCDEMRRCLETYDARAILAQHGGEVGPSAALDIGGGRG